jgi:hypothetical protein
VEDALGATAADGEVGRPRPLDGQVAGDIQLAAGQDDRAADGRVEGDGVAAGRGGNLAAQGAVAAVQQVGDGQCAGQISVFQNFKGQAPAGGPGMPPTTRPRTPGEWLKATLPE